MPELPEVETIRRALVPHLLNRRIVAIRATVDSLRIQVDQAGLRRVALGWSVTGIRRRAKYLIIDVAGGGHILWHLGMSGSFRTCDPDEPQRRHEHVFIELDDGTEIRFDDPRRFGSVEALGADAQLCRRLAALGPEPLGADFTPGLLHAVSRGRTRPVKNLIMDQTLVVGVGNIYANEALFRASINPRRRSGRLSCRSCERLVRSIRAVLREAIESGGTTISDFRSLDGSEGRFHLRLKVYGRAGEACPRCGEGSLVRRVILAGRSTFYCPGCQH